MEKDTAFNIIERRLFDSVDVSMDIDDEVIMERIQEEICEYAKESPLDVDDRIKLQKDLFYSLRKYDVLSNLLEDDDITEIMINGYNHIFIEKRGKVTETKCHFSSREKLDDVIQQIVGANNQVITQCRIMLKTLIQQMELV